MNADQIADCQAFTRNARQKDLLLCGSMFDLRLVRHRIFEVSGFVVTP